MAIPGLFQFNGQPLPRGSQAAPHGRVGQLQYPADLLGVEPCEVTQHEDRSQRRFEPFEARTNRLALFRQVGRVGLASMVRVAPGTAKDPKDVSPSGPPTVLQIASIRGHADQPSLQLDLAEVRRRFSPGREINVLEHVVGTIRVDPHRPDQPGQLRRRFFPDRLQEVFGRVWHGTPARSKISRIDLWTAASPHGCSLSPQFIIRMRRKPRVLTKTCKKSITTTLGAGL